MGKGRDGTGTGQGRTGSYRTGGIWTGTGTGTSGSMEGTGTDRQGPTGTGTGRGTSYEQAGTGTRVGRPATYISEGTSPNDGAGRETVRTLRYIPQACFSKSLSEFSPLRSEKSVFPVRLGSGGGRLLVGELVCFSRCGGPRCTAMLGDGHFCWVWSG